MNIWKYVFEAAVYLAITLVICYAILKENVICAWEQRVWDTAKDMFFFSRDHIREVGFKTFVKVFFAALLTLVAKKCCKRARESVKQAKEENERQNDNVIEFVAVTR